MCWGGCCQGTQVKRKECLYRFNSKLIWFRWDYWILGVIHGVQVNIVCKKPNIHLSKWEYINNTRYYPQPEWKHVSKLSRQVSQITWFRKVLRPLLAERNKFVCVPLWKDWLIMLNTHSIDAFGEQLLSTRSGIWSSTCILYVANIKWTIRIPNYRHAYNVLVNVWRAPQVARVCGRWSGTLVIHAPYRAYAYS